MKRLLTITLLGMLGAGLPLGASTLRIVCSACSYTTLAAAYTAAAAGDTIEIQENITESLSLNKNIALIRGTGNRAVTWNGGGSAALLIQSGLTAACTIENLVFDRTGSSNTITWQSLGAGASLLLHNCEIRTGPGAGMGFSCLVSFVSADQLVVRECDFKGSAGTGHGFYINSAMATGAVTLVNNVFSGFPASAGLREQAAQATVKFKAYHNVFDGCLSGMEVASVIDVRNNYFSGNSDDIVLAGSALATHFQNNAFCEGNEAGLAASNLTGVVRSLQYANPWAGDYRLAAGAAGVDAGVSVTYPAPAADKDGQARPVGLPDIGAYERNPALTNTPTPGPCSASTLVILPGAYGGGTWDAAAGTNSWIAPLTNLADLDGQMVASTGTAKAWWDMADTGTGGAISQVKLRVWWRANNSGKAMNVAYSVDGSTTSAETPSAFSAAGAGVLQEDSFLLNPTGGWTWPKVQALRVMLHNPNTGGSTSSRYIEADYLRVEITHDGACPGSSPSPSFTPSPTPSVSPSPTDVQSATSTVSPSATPTISPSPTDVQSATRTISPSATPTNSPSPTDVQSATSTFSPSATPTISPSPTDVQSATRTISPSATPTNSPSPTDVQSATLTISPSATPTISPSPTDMQSATPSISPSATPTISPSPTDVQSATPTRSPTLTISPSPTDIQSATATISPSATPTISPSPTDVQSATATISPSATPTISPSPTDVQSATPTRSPTPSISPSPTDIQSATPTISPSATPTISPSPTDIQSATATISPSATPTISPSPTDVQSATPTRSPTPSISPSPTDIQSATATISPSATPTISPSPTDLQSATATISPSATPTISPSPTDVQSATQTASPSPTRTLSPSATPTISPSPTDVQSATPTASPSATRTVSPSPTETRSPSFTRTPTRTRTPTLTATESATFSPSPTVSPSFTRSPSFTVSPTALPASAAREHAFRPNPILPGRPPYASSCLGLGSAHGGGKLSLFDLRRRPVRLMDVAPGQDACWDGSADDGAWLPSGVYAYVLELDGRLESGTVTVMR
jgi:hypothetical protein